MQITSLTHHFFLYVRFGRHARLGLLSNSLFDQLATAHWIKWRKTRKNFVTTLLAQNISNDKMKRKQYALNEDAMRQIEKNIEWLETGYLTKINFIENMCH